MKKDKLNPVIITIFFIITSIFLYGQSGNILIDFSRESYIPYQMLDVSNRNNIFLIYGPFGYLINMLLYKISLNINLLFIEALLIAYAIAIIFYNVVKSFTIKPIALFTTLFFITVSIYSNSNFSFIIPYSYSTLWAIFGIYLLLFSFLYKKEKLKYIILGFIALNKLEFFIPCIIFTLIYDIYSKKFKIKNYFNTMVIIFIGYLIFAHYNLLLNIDILHKMMHTNSLKYLYKGMGTLFDIKYLYYNLINLIISLIISLVSYKIFNKNKALSVLCIILLFIFINPQDIFQLGIFIAIVLTILNKKIIKQKDIILFSFSIILCSKALFATNLSTYSNFGYCLVLFYIFRQLSLIINKKWLIYYFSIFMLTLSFLQIKSYILYQKFPLETKIGTIKLYKSDNELIQKINNFIKNNVKYNENIIVIPEGQIINLLNGKSWQFYNSTFTPLDFETFGEKNLTNQLKKYKTDYIIIYPRDTSDYGAKEICIYYGVDFCKYIKDNYKQVKEFGDIRKVLIYNINEK